ncbi:MAG: hypothetical protein ACFFA0_13735 [Promethearchaeota archaeon]
MNKLTESPILKNPAVEHIDVHRHFYRYSKGEFIGPALKITKTNTRITLKGSHEYEDLILQAVVDTLSEEEVEIKGVLISGSDISNLISDLGFNWILKKSSGQTKNYKATILSKTNKELLLESIEAFRKTSYFLISFNVNPTCKVTTKKNVPQPSKKKVEEDDVSKRIQFCTGVMTYTDHNLRKILDLTVPDLKSELPGKWKNVVILNNYKITDIILPEDEENWGLKRILAIRKGKLFRSIDIDGDIIEKQYNIVV